MTTKLRGGKLLNIAVAILLLSSFFCDRCCLATKSTAPGTRKTILLVGPRGSGRSTLGNCLVNRDASLSLIRDYPFKAGVNNPNEKSVVNMAIGDKFTVIDTLASFDHPRLNLLSFFEALQEELALINNRISLVLFVMQQEQGKLSKELAYFFRLFQTDFFEGRAELNSMLVCNNCEKGWLATRRRDDAELNALLNSVHNRSFEFKLTWDVDGGRWCRFTKSFNASRNNSIHELVTYIDDLMSATAQQVDLSHVQTFEFKNFVLASLGPNLQEHDEYFHTTKKDTTKRVAIFSFYFCCTYML